MGLSLEYTAGQTPLDDDEKEGLLIKTIATRQELDEFEQKNIEQAVQWLIGRSLTAERILTVEFMKELHIKMFDDVWNWAGHFRKTEKSIGVDPAQISIQLKTLIDDAQLWLTKKTFSSEEMAITYKHRLVSIHCFANGNGRHSRLAADVIIEKIYNNPLFNWGATNLTRDGEARSAYLAALRAADKGNMKPLVEFARG